jgi:hypothetical protein
VLQSTSPQKRGTLLKNIALGTIFILSAFAWAWPNPTPADYTINIHVNASRSVIERDINPWQELSVVIDGRKYELKGYGEGVLLALGDYKAKLVKDEHKGTYDSLQVYEFLFSDRRTRKFSVVGQAE